MAELRYHPLLDNWVMVSATRDERPVDPKSCPFCPGGEAVPQEYDLLSIDNEFPNLWPEPPPPDPVGTGGFHARPARGKCEVVLYSSDHDAPLSALPPSHLRKVVDLWADRYATLSDGHECVLIVENHGEQCGQSVEHPHGQIHAMPHVPPKLAMEFDACLRYRRSTGGCLLCDTRAAEEDDGRRLLTSNGAFSAYVPFFAEAPYHVMITSVRHVSDLPSLDAEERQLLASTLWEALGALKTHLEPDVQYAMAMHQGVHLHLEFFPPYQNRDTMMQPGGGERGAWVLANPRSIEATAQLLRDAHGRFLKQSEQPRGGVLERDRSVAP